MWKTNKEGMIKVKDELFGWIIHKANNKNRNKRMTKA